MVSDLQIFHVLDHKPCVNPGDAVFGGVVFSHTIL